MSTFGYRSELRKYEEVDEDELLATLSSEELRELERELADIDPDDDVPIGLRQKDQTAKTPTASFDRDTLLQYWEEENNKKLLEDENTEPNLGKEVQPDKSRASGVVRGGGRTTPGGDKKKAAHKEKKAARHVSGKGGAKESEREKGDECKKEAPAGTKDRGPCQRARGTDATGQNPAPSPDRPSGNHIDVDRALERVLSDDPDMTEVNLNNIEDISQEALLRFAEALCGNTHVRVFSLSNTHADDRVALAISEMLRENQSVRNLNVESNFVSGRGILALLAALRHNRTLVELRFHNQRHICGGKVEMEMVQLLRENTTLLKLGYQFDLPGPRMAATGILTRNQDQQRQQRLQQKQEQSPPAASEPVPKVSNGLPKKPSQLSHNAENLKKNLPPPPPPPLDPPTRRIAETVKLREGANVAKAQPNQRKINKSKRLKNGANERESADILKDLRNALRPSLAKRRDESPRLPPPQRSSRDDLMAAIRGSSISSLKRVDP